MRRSARSLALLAADIFESTLRLRPQFVPPRRQVEKIGGFDFLEVGRHLASIAMDLGSLQPHERLLDVGCGVGRLAVALREYLATGEYAGFDIYRPAIRWCRRAIEPSHPNFHFTFVDVRNRHYNPRGSVEPESFTFPYASGSIDLAFASSVFTHLAPAAADRYLAEISRVLKPGGRFVASFFLLNDFSRERLEALTPRFIPVDASFAVQDPDDVEAAIAFDEGVVRDALARHGMRLADLRYGSWSGRSDHLSFQDFVLGRKV